MMPAIPTYGHGSRMILRTAMPGARHVRGLTLQQKIERASMPVTECGCWIWMQSGTRCGAGTMRVGASKISAPRASWMAFRGPIPNGLHVLHSCDVPACVNPDHLSLGTREENQRQRFAKGRIRNVWMWSSNLTRSPEPKRLSLKERIELHSIPEPNSGCWLWTGAGGRYGQLLVDRRPRPAHRLSWQVFRGPIPQGVLVLHHCDVPFCVNPDHLFLGDQTDNMRDCDRKGRRAFARGELVNTVKLAVADVVAIRASHESGVLLATRYRVSPSTIWDIRHGRSWRHL